METSLVFAPLLPLPVLYFLAGLAAVFIVVAIIGRLTGWLLRGLAAALLLFALSGPGLQEEDRDALSDVAIVVIDETASQTVADRPEQLALTEEALTERLDALQAEGVEVHVVRAGDEEGPDGEPGSYVLKALSEAAAEHAPDRIAGAIVVTDGQAHDPGLIENFPAPVHVLLTGHAREWDRRIVLETAPIFAIVDEEVQLRLRVEANGQVPPELGAMVPLQVSVDGETPVTLTVPAGQSVEVPLVLTHGGNNVVELTIPDEEGELTDRNNSALVQINGIRDRLRVLLVSGEPYPGERTWRNLLKSDSSVDLVHFTILRPPLKQDGVPVRELSLIAFPTRELFMDKVDEFDLIIFDRYRRRGVLPTPYLSNIARYVEDGGALLVASGPAFAGPDSLYRTPLAEVIPVRPTGQVIEEGYVPRISEVGERHPVTEGLTGFAPRPPAEDGSPGWGRWFRLIDTDPLKGQTVMTGPDDLPLLVLDRTGEGRVAMLASDQAWLWSRGYEGGGPQLELLRRLAHWLMKEPELEEETLGGQADEGRLRVTRRTLGEAVGSVTVTRPDGSEEALALSEVSPGLWQGEVPAEENGLYRLAEGETSAVVAVGPASPREFENPISDGSLLAPLAEATRGGVIRLEDGVPQIRRVAEGRVAAGRSWIGLAEREAYVTRDIRLSPLAPGWVFLVLAALLMLGAWRLEGR